MFFLKFQEYQQETDNSGQYQFAYKIYIYLRIKIKRKNKLTIIKKFNRDLQIVSQLPTKYFSECLFIYLFFYYFYELYDMLSTKSNE